MAKISLPDHRMQAFDPETGQMTPDFYKLLIAILTALNTLL
jgi:hypothetical protein